MNMPITIEPPAPAGACIVLFGIVLLMSVIGRVTPSVFRPFFVLCIHRIQHRLLISHLNLVALRYRLLMRLCEFRMCLCKDRIICLKRGYLTGDEPNLRSNFVLWSIAINHPVQVFNVIFESNHIVMRDVMPNSIIGTKSGVKDKVHPGLSLPPTIVRLPCTARLILNDLQQEWQSRCVRALHRSGWCRRRSQQPGRDLSQTHAEPDHPEHRPKRREQQLRGPSGNSRRQSEEQASDHRQADGPSPIERPQPGVGEIHQPHEHHAPRAEEVGARASAILQRRDRRVVWANSQSQITFNSGWVWTAWCVACQRGFLKALHRLVHLRAGHRQKRSLQSQIHVRIGQRFFGPP